METAVPDWREVWEELQSPVMHCAQFLQNDLLLLF